MLRCVESKILVEISKERSAPIWSSYSRRPLNPADRGATLLQNVGIYQSTQRYILKFWRQFRKILYRTLLLCRHLPWNFYVILSHEFHFVNTNQASIFRNTCAVTANRPGKRSRSNLTHNPLIIFFFPWLNSPSRSRPPQYRSCAITHHTRQDSPGRRLSRGRNLCLTTHNNHKRQTSMPQRDSNPQS
jgi:hypothetical protein